MKFFTDLTASLNTKLEGFSYRKVASTVVLGLVIYCHVKYINSTNVLTAILYDFGFISVLLGLLNVDRFVQLKFGAKDLPIDPNKITEAVEGTTAPVADPASQPVSQQPAAPASQTQPAPSQAA